MKNNCNVLDPRPVNSFSDLLEELFQEKPNESGRRFSPAVDIYEEDQLYGVVLALPGIKKENIKIEIGENKLQVSGARYTEAASNLKKHYVQEIPRGAFIKSFHLPKDVQQEKIEAKYEDGLLKLILPKSQKLKQKYQIEIK